jgi:hypothetical protein
MMTMMMMMMTTTTMIMMMMTIARARKKFISLTKPNNSLNQNTNRLLSST